MSGGRDVDWRPALPTDAPAEQVPGYEDLVEIGRGGDSVVYRARQVGLARDVAIKVQLVDDPERRARFEREVEITVDLGRQHPNIVTVLATGTTASGRPCIVMDYHQAGTLQDRLKAHGPLPVDEVVSIGVVLADALSFAHERGILHRDVKPQNVLVLPTSWVLADFGIARLADSEHTSSAETFTYRHAAPQILDGLPPTAADDIWSLGSTLFTLIDGRPPFASDDPDDDSALAYLRRARTEPHRRLTAPGTERIAAIIDRCLVKDVDQRWQSAAELRDALAGVRTTAWLPSSGARASGRAARSDSPETPGISGATGAGGEELQVAAAVAPEPAAPLSPEDALWAPHDHTRRRRDLAGALPAGAVASGAQVAEAPAARQVPGAPAAGEVAAVEPVALSVLAHAPAMADTAPTGTVTGLVAPPASPHPGGAGPQATPSRRRLLLTLGAVALLVGALLGIGVTLVRHRSTGQPTGANTGPGGQPVRSLTAPPTQTGDAQVTKPEADLRFLIEDLRFNGSGFDIGWRPPRGVQPEIYTLDMTMPTSPQLKVVIPGNTTTTSVPMFVKPGQRYCFAMTLHLSTGQIGIAEARCIKIRG